MEGGVPQETEEELREKCLDMTMEELVDELVVKHNQILQLGKVKEELSMVKASRESAEKRIQSMEYQGSTLMSRAMESEEKVLWLTSQLEALTLEHKTMSESSGANKADAEELATLREEVEGLRDAKTLVEAERQKAAEHNELRLSVEHAFNELSRQHEDLMKQLEAAQDDARELKSKAKIDAGVIVNVSEDRDQLRSQLEAQRKETTEAQRQEQVAKDELEAFQRKAAGWKKEADRVMALESKCDSLQKANERQALEIRDLQAQLNQAELDALKFEDERRKWQEEQKKTQKDKFLKQQVGELQFKLSNLLEKEKAWVKERAELQAKIKRLLFELGKKNPSQLRLMELEVQNELLLGMLQNTKGHESGVSSPKNSKKKVGGKPPVSPTTANSKAHYGGSPVPAPKVLPPLEKKEASSSDLDDILGNPPQVETISSPVVPAPSATPKKPAPNSSEKTLLSRPDSNSSNAMGMSSIKLSTRKNSTASSSKSGAASRTPSTRSTPPPDSRGSHTPASRSEDSRKFSNSGLVQGGGDSSDEGEPYEDDFADEDVE